VPPLDHATCYRALASRDARFDGQFIAGVRTTGIYCRPSCPATTPKPHNVSFYPTAAAAHEAGLRACKRCQPDAVPGNPDWNLRDDLAARAMRLITDGVVEREGVPGLAARLGYSSRHLGRVLQGELGAGPLALARAHRAESARALLAGTDLPVSEVAFAAGFASLRQCNDTVREVYGLAPTELRRLARSGRVGVRPDAVAHAAPSPDATGLTTVTVRLAARAPFDGAGLVRYVADHAVHGVEEVVDGVVRRWLPLPHGRALVRVRLDDERPGVVCTASVSALADVAPLVARVRRWFDLDADAAAIDAALGADALLGPLVAQQPGIRIAGAVDPGETLLRTIVGQQISLPAARTVLGRLAVDLDALEGREPVAGLREFPGADRIAAHGAAVLRGPASRIRTVLGVAEALASGALAIDVGMPAAELRARLEALPGVGPWTAGYVTMRVLGAPDILLEHDLVLLRSLRALGAAETATGARMLGARWAPWRSYATLHLWRAAPPPMRRSREDGAAEIRARKDER